MIKKIKTPFIIILCIALVALIILLRLSAGNEPAEEGHTIQYEFESDDMAWFFHNLSHGAKEGTTVDIRTDLLLDADILIWVDGQELKKSYAYGDSWVYSFTMPDKDVIVTAKMSGKKEGQEYVLGDKNDTIAVVMEVSDVTPTGLTVHFRQYEKRDVGDLIYGDGYRIERLEGDDWVELPVIPENPLFNDIGYFIPSEGEAQLAVDWEWLYGKLDSGTYRITKEVIVKEWSDPSSQPLKCLLAAQFIIE